MSTSLRQRLADLWWGFRLRHKRRYLLLRAIRRRRALKTVENRTANIGRDDILLFITLRNEARRLPYFLEHYRALGVSHFLVVDNESEDGSRALLAAQPDVSLWRTQARYRQARFGMDWLNWLLLRYGHGHWCVTVDADELLIYPDHHQRDLRALTAWLDQNDRPMMAAMMLDLFPKGPLSSAHCAPDQDPSTALGWFDPAGYSHEPLPRYHAVSIRGGPRKRMFFGAHPNHAPHLHKTPLIRWNRRYAYLSSTHIALPRRLNTGLAQPNAPTGVLLHSKFLDQVIEKSAEEKQRKEHFTHIEHYDDYYDKIIADPVLWHEEAACYEGWQQLQRLGLCRGGAWHRL